MAQVGPLQARQRGVGIGDVGGEDDETQSLPRTTDMIPSGPNTAVDFFVLHRLGLGVGEKREGEFASFGFPGWQFNATPVVIERVSEREYRSVMTVPFGEMTSTVTVRIVVHPNATGSSA